MNKPIVNFVISDDKASKIFTDIFRRFIDSELVEVVISEDPRDGCDVYHYHRAQLADEIRRNSVITVHHDIDDTDRSIAIEKFLPRFRKARHIVCLNSLQVERLRDYGVNNTLVIPHGFDQKILRKKTMRPRQNFEKLTLGLISKRYGRRVKGEAYLFQLLDRLDPELVDFYLVGAGRLEDAVYMRSLGYDVTLHESIPYKLFQSVYEKIDILLMLSNFEGGPANIPEAVGTGTPVITTRVGMSADMITDNLNGVFITGDPAEDAEQIIKLASNTEGCFDKLRQGSIENTPSPTWEGVVDQHLELYRNMMDEPIFDEPAHDNLAFVVQPESAD